MYYISYESSNQKSATANLPVLGGNMNTNEDTAVHDRRLTPSASTERTADEGKREIQRQQSSSSYLERKLQQQSLIERDEEEGSRGSGIEEIN